MSDAESIIKDLSLKPHPEGGHFVECFRTESISIIYYLLKKKFQICACNHLKILVILFKEYKKQFQT